jgi:hypothetical protein
VAVRRLSTPWPLGGILLLLVATLALADDPKPEPPPIPEAPKTEPKADTGSPNLKIPATTTGDRRKKLEEAIAAYKAAEAKMNKEGYKAAKAELELAGKKLRARVSEDASDPLPLYYLGILYQLQTDDKHAIENLLKVVKLAPRFHEAWLELGDAHWHLTEYEKAEQAYAHAIEVKPDYFLALKNRALERMDAGRLKEAREDIKRALEIKAGDLELLIYDRLIAHAIEGPKWTVKFEKETENYIVRTNVDQPFADWIAGEAEKIRKAYVELFEKTKIDLPKRKYTITVFANKEEYHKAGGPKTAGGHYDPRVRQLFFFKYPKPEDGQMVLFHEGFHQYLHPFLPNAPQWFNEGFGDYFGATKFVKVPREERKVVPNWWRLPMVKELIQGDKARPMKELMCMSRAELYDPSSARQNYAQSWSIIYFLCEYENRRYFPLLGKYFNALRAGKDQEEAFKAAFGDQDMKKLDKEWRDFINSL